MSKKKEIDQTKNEDILELDSDNNVRNFTLEDSSPGGISSAELLTDQENLVIDETADELLNLENLHDDDVVELKAENSEAKISEKTEESEKEKDPIFEELSKPKLPDLPKENRARLQMQSPTRLYFYWSIKNNPFQTLHKVFGDRTGSYTLVVKLVNRSKNTEEFFRVEPEGNWWFNVDADSDYRAEIGFYAPNRPFIRVIFSNEVRTPRKSPSKRRDYTPSFNVDAYQFAEVLDAAGYQRDAFEVAVAGDDEAAANEATQKTFSKLTGRKPGDFNTNESDEIRFAFLALASGYSLKDIESEISLGLFTQLENDIEKLSTENVLSALKEHFDIFADEFFEEEEIGEAVFGASLVNFPRKLKKRSVPKSLTPKLERLDRFSALSSSNMI